MDTPVDSPLSLAILETIAIVSNRATHTAKEDPMWSTIRKRLTRGFPATATLDIQILFSVAILFLLVPASPYATTPYQPLDQHDVGYSEQEIEPARFEIHYSGTWRQSHETVGKYALFRSAELADEMGFPFFIIESMSLFDEPEVRIVETCSGIRVLSDTTVPASSVSVHYLREQGEQPFGFFSTQEIREMKPVLLEKKQPFSLSGYLQERGVRLTLQ